ncbi:MAG: flagellar protein FlgN [Oscillospiraceae bacterium]|jgi:flagellar biosynthesis/type III secretory pathway chaperone|nr:flagellar protein FlgN [Oscillospiraceae bacterium]
MDIAMDQAKVLRELLAISYEKRLAITADDVDELRRCSELELELVGRLNVLTKRGGEPTPEVLELARELKARNRMNDDLISAHLEYVNTMVAMLTMDSDPLSNYYTQRGTLTESPLARSAAFDVSV